MAEIFAAMDISTVATAVSAGIIGFIGIDLLFLGGKFVKRILRRG